MSSSSIGNQYLYNGPGYLDAKIQPVEHIEDLNKILLRQRFEGLTVTVLHPDGDESKPADYWLVQDPNEEKGVLMWERKPGGGDSTVVSTNTPDYITVTRDGNTYYVDASGNLVEEFEEVKSGITAANERIDTIETRVETVETKVEAVETRVETVETEVSALTETIANEIQAVNERVDSEVSALTEVITNEVERIDVKDAEQDERIDEISKWHIEKLSDGSGLTQYALVDSCGNTIGDTIDIIDEQYLESVVYIPSATQEDKDLDESVIIGDPYLKFVWKYGIITYVAVKDWVNDYFEGPGISISPGHEISVKLSTPEEGNNNYLSTGPDGLKMNMFIEIDE